MKGQPINILILVATDKLSGPARQIIQFFEYADRNLYHLLLAGTWVDKTGVFDLSKDGFFDEMNKRAFPFEILRQKFRFDPSVVQQAYKIIKKNGIHIIQTHGYKAAVIGFVIKMITGMPWVAFMHGETQEDMKVRIFQEIGFQLVRFADRIVTVSKAMRHRYIQRGVNPEKLVVLHNALDQSLFCESSERSQLSKQFKIRENDLVIGVIGRLSAEKGQRYFLEAFKRLRNLNQRLKALIVGEGPNEEILKKYCGSNDLEKSVIFTGYQENISNIYHLVDLIVLPSLSEGLPNVAMEALFHQKPVVATNVGGIPEVIMDGYNGILVPPKNIDRMVNAIETILADEKMRITFAINGKKMIGEKFSPEIRVKKITGIYDSVLKDKII
ncbi:MAG: glycosyltransferase family 1 protein [Desulfobacteraceae bacterium]|nr:MAG: glycosyltransferase family 1 protein [Desulfobacteraceae bacterium]